VQIHRSGFEKGVLKAVCVKPRGLYHVQIKMIGVNSGLYNKIDNFLKQRFAGVFMVKIVGLLPRSSEKNLI
jgi:hypothetical protein